MNLFYAICLSFGLFLTILSLFFSADGHGLGGEHGFFHVNGISPFRPIIIFSFITMFGGFGLIGKNLFSLYGFLSAGAAFALAFLGAAAIFFFLVVPMIKSQSNSLVIPEELENVLATVITPIEGNNLGEVSYVAGGTKHVASARIIGDENKLENGSEVVIVKFEKNTAMVIKKPKI